MTLPDSIRVHVRPLSGLRDPIDRPNAEDYDDEAFQYAQSERLRRALRELETARLEVAARDIRIAELQRAIMDLAVQVEELHEKWRDAEQYIQDRRLAR